MCKFVSMTVIHVLLLGNVFRGTLFVTRFNKKKDVLLLLLYFKHMLLPISCITLTHYTIGAVIYVKAKRLVTISFYLNLAIHINV